MVEFNNGFKNFTQGPWEITQGKNENKQQCRSINVGTQNHISIALPFTKGKNNLVFFLSLYYILNSSGFLKLEMKSDIWRQFHFETKAEKYQNTLAKISKIFICKATFDLLDSVSTF